MSSSASPADEAVPPDRVLNLTGVTCPLTFAKTTVALSEMPAGHILEVILDAGEPADTVPRSLRLNGHQILIASPTPAGGLRLRVRSSVPPVHLDRG